MHHSLPREVLLQRRTALPRQLEILLRAHRHGVHAAEADVEEGEGDVVHGVDCLPREDVIWFNAEGRCWHSSQST